MWGIVFFIISALVIFPVEYTHAGSFGIGVHSGYGIVKYEEQTSAFGTELDSESTQNVILLGVSGEYTLLRPENFYIGITTDWVFGLKDEEVWREDQRQIQTNDMRFFGQFYDLRFGYKDTLENLYYRFYVAGGWDGLHFKRDRFIWRGSSLAGSVTEDFSLWRVGVGIGLGYKIGKWALDGRGAFGYYPWGEVDNSSLPQFTFDTEGSCLDLGFGVSREMAKNLNFYIGGSYTLIRLDQSDIMQSGSVQAVFPNSRTEMVVGVINLTYAF